MKFLLFITPLIFIACSKSTPIPKEKKFTAKYVDSNFLKKIDFKGEELISVFLNNHYYYVRKNGKIIKTLTHKNKADPFSDGLARTRINGKIGFFNTNLDIVLDPIYDFAFPFYKGEAEICTGCKEKKEKGNIILDGGRWQKINREGLVVE